MIITYDCRNKFLGHAFKNGIIKNKYGVKPNCTTTAYPQAKSALEQIQQGIANPVRIFDLRKNYLYEEDPWAGILQANYSVVQST